MRRKNYSLSGKEKDLIIARISKLLAGQPEITFAYLYGSFPGNLPFHDLDVAIYVENIDLEMSSHYALQLAQELSISTKLPVDVRILNKAPCPFVYQVIRGQLLVEKNPDLRGRFVERTIRQYLDIKPILRRATKEAFAS